MLKKKLYSFIPQCRMMGEELHALSSCLPQNVGKDGDLIVSKSNCWCSDFYNGILWCQSQRYSDKELKQLTQKMTTRIEAKISNSTTPDLGITMHCGICNGFRIAGDGQDKENLISLLKSLCNRLHSKFTTTILSTLSSPAYGANESEINIFLNSMVSVPHNFKVDVPLSYATTTCSSAITIEKKALE